MDWGFEEWGERKMIEKFIFFGIKTIKLSFKLLI